MFYIKCVVGYIGVTIVYAIMFVVGLLTKDLKDV